MVASAVFGLVIALGFLLLPFQAQPEGGSGAPRSAVDCGPLISHYLGDPADPACDDPADDRALTSFAGLVLAVVASGVLRRASRAPEEP